MECLYNCMFFIAKCICYCFGDVYVGYFTEDTFVSSNCFEKLLCIFPSCFNHFYARKLHNTYLYKRNNLYYHSSYQPTCQVIPPLLECNINDTDFKDKISSFANNTPLKYILIFYNIKINLNDIIYFKFLKNGIINLNRELISIKDNTLIQILE